MDNIKNILDGVFKDLSKSTPKTSETSEKIWSKLIEAKEKEHTVFLGEKNNNIFINVDSSTWMYHMRTRKNALLQKIQKEFPHIKNLIFKVGNINE